MKKFSVKTIVAIGIGAALFFVLGRFVAIPSPVANTTISVQYGLLAFLAVVYGPVAGALIGFIGQHPDRLQCRLGHLVELGHCIRRFRSADGLLRKGSENG